jgi:hypothetical protein
MTFLQDFTSPCDQEYKTKMIEVTSHQYKMKKIEQLHFVLERCLC